MQDLEPGGFFPVKSGGIDSRWVLSSRPDSRAHQLLPQPIQLERLVASPCSSGHPGSWRSPGCICPSMVHLVGSTGPMKGTGCGKAANCSPAKGMAGSEEREKLQQRPQEEKTPQWGHWEPMMMVTNVIGGSERRTCGPGVGNRKAEGRDLGGGPSPLWTPKTQPSFPALQPDILPAPVAEPGDDSAHRKVALHRARLPLSWHLASFLSSTLPCSFLEGTTPNRLLGKATSAPVPVPATPNVHVWKRVALYSAPTQEAEAGESVEPRIRRLR
ncbi:uncharacterized protein LOC134738672 isoform X1 [Pongo pygmaeus]|uniref:uncharacterized protein LOC134738672 isoform X1 n=1 Tax=Pongo pygmaeus TaxID=9600 RepID=UPI00300DB780